MYHDAPDTTIYLDNAATTRVREEVVAAMERALRVDYGNPSSRHAAGVRAEEQLRWARDVVARQAGVSADQLTFTSGGTEANALAMLGVAGRRRAPGHVLVSTVEHPSVGATASLLEQRHGHSVERVPVRPDGAVKPERVERMLRPDTFLVAVMHVNNETGVVQPVDRIAELVHRARPDCLVLADAVQSFATLSTRLPRLGVDLLTASAHKLHGPKGVGCLVRRRGVELAPLWGGGGQEAGLRPGTENMAGIVGFARAVELCGESDPERTRTGLDRLVRAARRARGDVYEIGDPSRRAPHITCLGLPGLPTEALVNLLEARGVCVSSGSACHSRRSLRSHVMEAMGVPRTHGVLRLSLGHTTTDAQIEAAARALTRCLGEL